METFVRNYWSLYLDFLHDFRDLKYDGFSLPYLCQFHKLLRKNAEIGKMLHDPTFIRQLKHKIKDQKQVQQVFDKLVASHTKKPLIKNKQGRVLFFWNGGFRFPKQTFDAYFEPSKSIIIQEGAKTWRKNKKTGSGMNMNTKIPTDFLSNYPVASPKAIIQIRKKISEILNVHKQHPVYKNEKFRSALVLTVIEVIHRMEQVRRLLSRVSVSCIVLSNTYRSIPRILSIIGAEKGIPVISMQHGTIGGEFAYLPKVAAIEAVYGNYEKDWYKKLGIPDNSLKIIGHPRFDQAFEQSKITRSQFNKRLGLDMRKKTLMIVLFQNESIHKWRMLIETISKKLPLNIVIKDRPGINGPHDLTKEFSFVHSNRDYNLYDIFPNVDAVVSYPSTVGLEAMLADKPVFIMNTHKKLPGATDYYYSLDKLIQSDPQKLGKLIIKYFNDPVWENYVKTKREAFLRYAYPDFSKSGARLKKLINTLTGN
ncbi:hypothetical protein [Virgibacillus ihumii]|uniref:hypothetical protein n=1 Tax=Virgibacillus ihumii TaxID=2686091 RepID=UPI00157C8A27|nr:hypothetical protein [Virgibacillus ihumii]